MRPGCDCSETFWIFKKGFHRAATEYTEAGPSVHSALREFLMLTKRIIACLDVDAGRVVKGTQFLNLRDAGDPAELARAHSESGADEIVLLDISATHENRGTLIETVRRTARELFIPFTVGGGIRTLDDAAAIFDAGADKISINSSAVKDPAIIERIAARFGSQAVVVAIDARSQGTGPDYDVLIAGGRKPTGRIAVEWALVVG